MNKTVEGIVLSTRDYREQDAIITVLCKEEGVQSLVARGLRKLSSKNVGSTQVFTHGLFYIDYHEQKNIHTMRTADILESYHKLREDLLLQAGASILCECIEKVEWDDPEELFLILKTSLTYLQSTTQPYALFALFLSIMNRIVGIEPYVDGCVGCQRVDGIAGISLSQGGFVCASCMDEYASHTYSKQDLKCFRLLCKAQLENFPILEQYQDWRYEHFMMVYRFFEEYSGIPIKSIRFLKCLQEL